MADEFDLFLRGALAPPVREPERRFIARVETRIALEERLAAQRGTILRQFGLQIVALAAIAAGLLWLGRAPAVAEFAARSPALVLGALLAGFALLILALTARGGEKRAAL